MHRRRLRACFGVVVGDCFRLRFWDGPDRCAAFPIAQVRPFAGSLIMPQGRYELRHILRRASGSYSIDERLSLFAVLGCLRWRIRPAEAASAIDHHLVVPSLLNRKIPEEKAHIETVRRCSGVRISAYMTFSASSFSRGHFGSESSLPPP